MSCGWEGNRRSGAALAMRHRLQWFIHLRAHGIRKGDEHPAYTPHAVWHSFFTIYLLRLTSVTGWQNVLTTVRLSMLSIWIELYSMILKVGWTVIIFGA